MVDKIIFSSEKYDYYIDFWDGLDRRLLFEVSAMCKRTGRTSIVTTVNEVMSYFGANPDKKRFQDSPFRLKRKEILKFQNAVAELMVTNYLSWLDTAMDKDREVGEWENLAGGE